MGFFFACLAPSIFYHNTNCWCNRSRVASASSQNPGCTLEVWTTVLLVAVNHRKREARSSEAIGPPALSPLQIRSILWRCSSTSWQSRSPHKALNRSLLTVNLDESYFRSLQYKITPTFRNSSRSTLGTMRMMAYSNKYFPGMLCFFYKIGRMRDPVDKKLFIHLPVFYVGRSGCWTKPVLRYQWHNWTKSFSCQYLPELFIRFFQFAGPWQQHMVFNLGKWLEALFFPVGPWMMKIQCSSMINKP